ncbi:hypothetical protein ACFFP0_08470 [Rhizobium puerariae]|uniref:Heme oxygenase n=1 Tax=Rhizobium puerariae TaxID=1585791 RepID=A0ABV6AFL2_9HYPH
MTTLPASDIAVGVPVSHLRQLSMLGDKALNDLRGRFLAARPFANHCHYGCFLSVQYLIASELKPVYSHPLRSKIFPFLKPTDHIVKIEGDMRDLGSAYSYIRPVYPAHDASLNPAHLCGTLFIAEGLRLMFPYFRKQAEHLGFDSCFGARHLACDASGIRQRWTAFVTTVNSMCFSAQDMVVMAAAADRTIKQIRTVIDGEFGSSFNGNERLLHG